MVLNVISKNSRPGRLAALIDRRKRFLGRAMVWPLLASVGVSAGNGVLRSLGRITGAPVMGADFAFAFGTVNITASRPAAVDGGLRVAFAVAAAPVLVALVIASARRLSAAGACAGASPG